MANLFIKNAGFLITMDEERRIIQKGAMMIRGKNIVKVDKTEKFTEAETAGCKVIDAAGSIVMPGLCNGHIHSNQQFMRGVADNVFLPTYLHERAYPLESAMSPEEVYLSALCMCLDAIKTGTTFFIDPGGYHMEQVVRAVNEIGIRGILMRSCVDMHTNARPIPGKMLDSTKSALDAGEEFIAKYNNAAGGRVKAWFSLRTERMVSEDLCRGGKEIAEKYGVGIGSHMTSNPDSVNRHKEVFRGLTPLMRFHQAGILGPNLILHHANWLTDEEIELVRKYDVKIAHCPTAGFAMGFGALHGKHIEMMKMGVTVCVGSDTAGASNSNDMFRVMYCVAAHRDHRLDASLFPPETLLEMALTNGVKAANWQDEIGSLEAGKKADVIILDTSEPEWIPLYNPISNLALAANGNSVQTSIIDGELIMENRKLKTVDEREVLARGQQVAHSIVERSGLTRYAQPYWPIV